MDFNPLKKSFKAHGSYKHMRRLSSIGGAGTGGSSSHEELPILSDHQSDDPEEIGRRSSMGTLNLSERDHSEVIVNMNDGDEQREPNFGLGQQAVMDPPTKLIGQFLNKQKGMGGEISLDMEMEMDELRSQSHQEQNLTSFPGSTASFREICRVSFQPSVSGSSGVDSAAESVRRRYKEDAQVLHGLSQEQQRREEVLRCTSNASFRKAQANNLSRLKTKSRLLDDPPPEEMEKRSGKIPNSGQLRSGMLGRDTDDDDEDDPLEHEDLPEEYKRNNLNTLTILQWVSLIAIIGALVCSLSIPVLRKENILNLKPWKWEVLLLVLICGRLVSGWGIRLIVFFIERNFLLRKRVLYFVYGLRKGVQNCWWLGLVLLAWQYLFDEKVHKDTHSDFLKYVTKILVCFLVANFIWLIKTLMVKVLASSFHVSTYFDRIQESVFNQFVIETLSGPPLIEIQKNEEEIERTVAEVHELQNAGASVPPDLKAAVFPQAKSGRMTASGGLQKSFKVKSIKISRQLPKKGEKKRDDGITIDHLHKLNTRNVSAWNMKRLMNIVRHGSLSTLDEQILGATAEDESIKQIRSEYEAKAAARKIFYNVACPGSKYIYLQDLMQFMREDEALKTMSFFEEASDNSRISKSSLKNWVVNAFRERRALALTLNDTKTAVNKLHHMINIIVGILIVVICLVILGIATSKFFVLLGSQIVVVSFIFGNTAKTLFESIIFLFIIHPFDVGDRCEVDGVQMIVEEMNILTTVFLRADNQKIVYPNNILATKSIGNYYRSPDMGDAVEFYIHICTPPEKIALMKQRIISFIETKKEHWYSNPMVVLMDVEDFNKLKIAIWIRHRMNHQDMGEKWSRRAVLLEEMVKIFRELDLQYRLFPLDINIRTLPPSNSSCPKQSFTSN